MPKISRGQPKMTINRDLVLAGSVFLLTLVLLELLPLPLFTAIASTTLGDVPPGLTPVAYLPYVAVSHPPTPTPPPGPVALKVYDMYGVERTYQWAVNKYGVRVEQSGGWAYHGVELRERSGPSSLDVWVYLANGLPAAGVRVEFHWPGDMAVRYTELSGKAGFGYGPGSWITDPAVGGPHWLVVENPSACDAVSRLGMLAGTPHDHLDVSYRYGYLSP
ncbi:MAG: hypothetical protein WBB22_01085 [Anaerolineae bacterium]